MVREKFWLVLVMLCFVCFCSSYALGKDVNLMKSGSNGYLLVRVGWMFFKDSFSYNNNPRLTAKNNYQFVILVLDIYNQSHKSIQGTPHKTQTFTIKPDYCFIRAQNGKTYKYDPATYLLLKPFVETKLGKDENTVRAICFQLPKNTVPEKFIYNNGRQKTITIPLN